MNRIHIQRARRGKHTGVAGSLAPCRVAGRITSIEIRFRLHNPAAQPVTIHTMQQRFADQFRRDGRGGPLVERLRQTVPACDNCGDVDVGCRDV